MTFTLRVNLGLPYSVYLRDEDYVSYIVRAFSKRGAERYCNRKLTATPVGRVAGPHFRDPRIECRWGWDRKLRKAERQGLLWPDGPRADGGES